MQYKPGVCNIGAEEKRARLLVGSGFAVLSVALAMLWWSSRLLPWVSVPIFISALGFVQARQNFCVYYGLKGKQGMTGFGEASDVKNASAHGKDVNHSLVLIFAAVVIAAGITTVLLAF